MIRKSNEEGSTVTCDESASSITQGGSSDYNPKDDEGIDGEEVDDIVVKKNDKVQTLVLFGGVGLLVCYVLPCFNFITYTQFSTCDLSNVVVLAFYEALQVCRIKKKCAVRKTTRRKVPETSAPMAPGRVFADPPGGSKRLLEVHEPAPTRVTRSKVLKVPNHEDSQVHKDQ
jgi:hypothetical protein